MYMQMSIGRLLFLILMSYNAVFIVKAIIRAAVVSSLKEAVHFVLIEVNHAHIAVIVLVKDIIRAGLAVCSFFLFHDDTPSKCR